MMKQTIANQYLIRSLVRELKFKASDGTSSRIMNIGASTQIFIENNLTIAGCNYVADRVDIDNCTVVHLSIDHCWQCSVESMHPVNSQGYELAFANWVLEHVNDLDKASKEIHRILKPSGKFVATIPNPVAPEFLVAKVTPLWLHKMIRGGAVDAWETHYAYSSIEGLITMFSNAGLRVIEVKYFPTLGNYLSRFPFLNVLGKLYDSIISKLQIRPLLGHVCVIFEKI